MTEELNKLTRLSKKDKLAIDEELKELKKLMNLSKDEELKKLTHLSKEELEEEFRMAKVKEDMDRRSALLYMFEKGLAEGRAKAEAERQAEGEAESLKKVAKSLLQDGLSIEVIKKYTGLSEDEIEPLKKS